MTATTRQSEAAPVCDEAGVPLYVDLDDTLVRNGLFAELLFLLLRQKPIVILVAPLWLLRGMSYARAQLASHIELDAGVLPYREELVDYVREQRARGRRAVLSTSFAPHIAEKVAAHTQAFDGVAGAAAIEGAYEFVGSHARHLPLFEKAARATAVDVSPAQAKRLASATRELHRIDTRARRRARAVVKALRPHQWAKNLLILVPLSLSHQLLDGGRVEAVLAAFVSFSLCASSVYVVNDLLDLAADRKHPRKRKRPFAAGDLSALAGVALVPVLLAASAAIALLLVHARFALVLLAYYALTLGYTFVLKRMAILDVIVLAGLYTMRLLAGAVAADVVMSYWLSAFSLFLFLDLALMKRYTELSSLDDQEDGRAHGRGYHVKDLPHLASMGTGAGYVAVLVLALYLQSADVEKLYARPAVLWGMLPLMLYWVSRLWLVVARGEMHDDPIVFAIKDKASYLVAAALLVVVALAV